MGALAAMAAACAPSRPIGAVCPVSRAEITSATTPAPPSESSVIGTGDEGDPRGFEVRSACASRIRLFYGDRPGESSGTLVHVDPRAEAVGPRRQDGTQSVWLVDERENALGSVVVAPGTRRVEVDATCGGLRAF